jgi:hypothetical protein
MGAGQDSTEIDLTELWHNSMDRMYLAQDDDQSRNLHISTMNF